jgi:hypothetical protein
VFTTRRGPAIEKQIINNVAKIFLVGKFKTSPVEFKIQAILNYLTELTYFRPGIRSHLKKKIRSLKTTYI